jgi:hypothetical protein
MPKKTTSTEGIADAFASDIRFKSYANKGKGSFAKLDEGSEIAGIFVSVRFRKIKDRRTHEPKTIRVYAIRTTDGEVQKVGSRALLDSCFDDIMDEHGGYTVEDMNFTGPGIKWITNRLVKFVRGEDTETSEGDEMGTYEILVEEDTKS